MLVTLLFFSTSYFKHLNSANFLGAPFTSFLLTSSSLLTNSVKAMLVVVTTGEDTFAAGEAEAFGAGKAASAYQAAIVRRKQLMYAG